MITELQQSEYIFIQLLHNYSSQCIFTYWLQITAQQRSLTTLTSPTPLWSLLTTAAGSMCYRGEWTRARVGSRCTGSRINLPTTPPAPAPAPQQPPGDPGIYPLLKGTLVSDDDLYARFGNHDPELDLDNIRKVKKKKYCLSCKICFEVYRIH